MGAGSPSTPSVSASPASTQGRSPFSGSSTVNSSMNVGYGPGQVDPGLAAALSGRPAASVSPMTGISPGQSRAMIGNTSLAGMSPAQARQAVADENAARTRENYRTNQFSSPSPRSAPASSTQGRSPRSSPASTGQGRSPRGPVGYGAPGNFGAANAAAQAMGFAGAVGNVNPNTGVRSAVTSKKTGKPIGYGKKSTTSKSKSKSKPSKIYSR